MKKFKITLSLHIPKGGELIVNDNGIVTKTQVPFLKRFIGMQAVIVERYVKRMNGTIEEVK